MNEDAEIKLKVVLLVKYFLTLQFNFNLHTRTR